MADWMKQAEELMKTWTKAQQEVWDTWRASIPTVGSIQAGESWEKAIGFWKEAADRSHKAQMEWAQLWADSIKAQKGAPKELGQLTDQLLATMKTWNDAQAQFWGSMFDSMQQASPEMLKQRMDEGSQVAFKAWQDAVKKAVESQQELMSLWSGKGEKKG
jgi:hypothetical protein